VEGDEEIEYGGRRRGEKICCKRKVTCENLGTSCRIGDQLNEDQVGDADTAPVMTHLTDLFQRYFDKGRVPVLVMQLNEHLPERYVSHHLHQPLRCVSELRDDGVSDGAVEF
jgi:hypothetical protein